MNLRKHFLTENLCYQRGYTIKPCGVMVHSTGAANPRLSRYVDDPDLAPASPYHWNVTSPGGRNVCPHAFIGKMPDGSIATYQTLPWTMRGWHSGKGPRGSANVMGYIGFEICEGDLTDENYFRLAYTEAVELTAFLCQRFGLDPAAPGVVICHSEGCSMGIASNHADVMHWFPVHGKSMNTFRMDVAQIIEEENDMLSEEKIRQIVRSEMEAVEAARAIKPPSTWARQLLNEAKEMGITDGSRPLAHVTRQECAIMCRAAAKYKG